MDVLINKIIEIIKPLIDDSLIPESERNLINKGFDILNDENLPLKERIEQSMNVFDIAQHKPYNPFHARVQLSKAIATYEEYFGKDKT